MVTIMSDNKKQWTGETEIPSSVCIFSCEDAVRFADDGGNEKKSVRLVGYRGDIIMHWFWGKFAMDMDGLIFKKKKTPGLIDHKTDRRLTFGREQNIKPEVYITGPFLDNEDAIKLKSDMDQGFPFQASLSVDPEIVEQVAEGQSVKVNGKTLKGPGAVFRKASIWEISATVFGAFSNTESSAYADDNEHNVKFNLIKEADIMAEKTEKLTIEKFTEQYPELHKELSEKVKAEGLAEGKKSEQDRFAELKDACGNDSGLLVECFSKGMTTGDALKMRAEKAEAANTKLGARVTELTKKKMDPAVTEFSDTATEPGKGEKFDEKTATDEQLKEHFAKTRDVQDRFSSAEAYIAAVRHPQKK